MTLALLLALVGCGQTEGDPNAPTPPTVGDPGANPGAGDPLAGPATAPPVTEPKFTQEQLAAQTDVVKIAGSVACTSGNGPFIIQLYPPPPDQGGPKPEPGDGPPGPITQASVAAVGELNMLAPKGGSAVAVAFLDSDGNGMATPGEPLFFGGGAGPTALNLEADLTGVVFDCAAVAAGGASGSPTPSPGAAPPAGEVPAGEVPAGAEGSAAPATTP